jgi:cytochrome c-type biogenesis protein CcmH/NrfG
MSDECQCRCGKAGCISEGYTEEGKQKRAVARWRALGLLDDEADKRRRIAQVSAAMQSSGGHQ